MHGNSNIKFIGQGLEPIFTAVSYSFLGLCCNNNNNNNNNIVLHRTGNEGPEGEQRYSSTLSLTSALDGVGGQRHAPATFTPGKDPIRIV